MKKLFRLMEKVNDTTYKLVSKSYDKTKIELRKQYWSKVYPNKHYEVL